MRIARFLKAFLPSFSYSKNKNKNKKPKPEKWLVRESFST